MESNRRSFIKALAALGISMPFQSFNFKMADMIKRKIPSSGEEIPCVGLGTSQAFDVGGDAQMRAQLAEVLKAFVDGGATLIDSSPMYGRSEKVIGDLSSDLGISDKLFGATKVWTTGTQSGIDQMEESMDLMKIRPMDLMQIHNLQDWETHMKTLRDWKEQGKVRYIGITHYQDNAFSRLESVMKQHPIDFVQFNYSIAGRTAEKSILPLAQDRGIATLINRPYDGGSLFGKTRGKEIPEWAKEIGINSWGQFFMKYILAHPGVTCPIPRTAKPHHLIDNLAAGMGRLPDDAEKKKMIAFIEGL